MDKNIVRSTRELPEKNNILNEHLLMAKLNSYASSVDSCPKNPDNIHIREFLMRSLEHWTDSRGLSRL